MSKKRIKVANVIRLSLPYAFRRKTQPIFLDRFPYANGLVNAVTGGTWNDIANILLVTSNKAATPATVDRQQMSHTLPTGIDLRKPYEFGSTFVGSDFGGSMEVFCDCLANDDQSGSRLVISYTTAGGALQLQIFQGLGLLATVADAVLSPLVRGGVAGNNFGLEFSAKIAMGPNTGVINTRNVRAYVNGTQVVNINTGADSANANKRLALAFNWGPTQLFKMDNVFFDQ